MKRRALWLVLPFVIFTPLVWSASVTQRTTGFCSPPVANLKGYVKIEINCRGLDPSSVKLLMKSLNDVITDLPHLAENINQMREEVRQAITKEGLDTKRIEEIIALKHRAIFASSELDAKRWAQELLESSSSKEKEVKSLAMSGRELADKLLLQWNPLYDFFQKELDNRISELKQTGVITNFEEIHADLLVVDSESRAVPIRRITFLGNAEKFSVTLNLFQGQIHRGKLVKPPHLQFEEMANGASYLPISLVFRQFEIRLDYVSETDPATRNKTYQAKSEDPLSDEELRRLLSMAIGNSLSFVYLNSAASRQ